MKRPHRFKIEIDPTFSQPTRYSIGHGAITVQVGLQVHRSAVPTLVQWSGFWRLCNFIDLWSWRPDYTPELESRDGQSWSLTIAYDKGQVVTSRGYNGYPSLESVHTTRTTMDRFGLLLHFIDITLLSPRFDFRDDYSERLAR